MTRYFQPNSLDEAREVLSGGGDIRPFAGGTDLLVLLRLGALQCDALMDVKRIPETSVFDVKDGVLRIGAAITCSEVAGSPLLAGAHEALRQAANNLANSLLRNRATLVGNLCNASPGADMAGACLVLGSTLVTSSATGGRRIPLAEFFTGVKRHVLEPAELVLHIEMPLLDGRGFYLKKRRIHGHDLAQVGVSAAYSAEHRLTFALGAVAITPLLIDDLGVIAPSELAGKRDMIVQAVTDRAKPISDVRASANYRKAMVAHFTGRIIDALISGKEAANA